VTVPVGQFTRALRVETTEELIVVYSRPDYPSSPSTRYSVDWYASGVGWIKRTAGRESPTTTSELIAYAVGDNRRGLVPSGWLARDLDSASSRHRPAIGYDGTRFLVVSPTAKRTGPVFTTGNLQAIVVDRDGTPVVSRALLDTRDRYGGVSIAWDGTRYLVAYHNGDYRRLELLTVSRNGETIEGPILFEETLSLASTVATKTGFLVAYTKSMPDPGGGFRGISHAWIATVDGQGHATSRVEILPGSEERTPVLAVDGDGRALMLFHAPAAALSQPGPNDVLAAVFIGGDGRVTGSGPFVVAAAPGAIHTETNLLFDGTNFVASWLQQDGLSSATKLHVARISPAGALLGRRRHRRWPHRGWRAASPDGPLRTRVADCLGAPVGHGLLRPGYCRDPLHRRQAARSRGSGR
jgi:hypothetical protein